MPITASDLQIWTSEGLQILSSAAGGNSPPAYYTNASFTMPSSGSTVTVAFLGVSGLVVGQTLGILDTNNKFAFMEITAISSLNVTLKNQGYAANSTGSFAVMATCWISTSGLCTSTNPGMVPPPPNDVTQCLLGSGAFGKPTR